MAQETKTVTVGNKYLIESGVGEFESALKEVFVFQNDEATSVDSVELSNPEFASLVFENGVTITSPLRLVVFHIG